VTQAHLALFFFISSSWFFAFASENEKEEHRKSRGKPAYQMSPEKEREHRRTRGDWQAGPEASVFSHFSLVGVAWAVPMYCSVSLGLKLGFGLV
jgi:hypothetical protein